MTILIWQSFNVHELRLIDVTILFQFCLLIQPYSFMPFGFVCELLECMFNHYYFGVIR
jgi:hypothetical protein